MDSVFDLRILQFSSRNLSRSHEVGTDSECNLGGVQLTCNRLNRTGSDYRPHLELDVNDFSLINAECQSQGERK